MMTQKNYNLMKNFTIRNIPNLDIAVLGALELFETTKIPELKIPNAKKIIVIGSGNSMDTGKIIFSDTDAVYESESTYKERLKHSKFNLAILISASGGKHAPLIAKYLKIKTIKTILLTNNSKAKAKKFVNKTLLLPKQKEPYTYNTSTYMSMILSKTKENPREIYKWIEKINKKIPKNLAKYDAYYLIVPEKFDAVRQMFVTKFDELFGSKKVGRAYTFEETKHAKTVVPNSKELFISFDTKNLIFGKNRLHIPLPKNADYATILAIGYYVIGKIQKQNTPYFKKNIVKYVKSASKIFGEEIKPIVE